MFQACQRFSLSLRERAGVRGNFPVNSIVPVGGEGRGEGRVEGKRIL
jgi:hypothetical protein